MPEPRKLSVFLCHASQDKPIVRDLYKRLSATDWIDPWLDEEKLSLGQHWTSTIEEAIDSADNVIIFLSQNSVQKEGFVQRELYRAWNRSLEKPQNVIFLIPFRLDDCEVPYNLRERQWGDYFGEKKEKTYEDLLRSLKKRYQQKLLLEKSEQVRAEELARIHKEEERTSEQTNQVGVPTETKESPAVSEPQARQEQVRERPEPKPITHSALSGGGSSGILLDGAIVHYETLGRGRPVIFLHGWVGSWRYWYSSMQLASRSFRSYALDLWGFGGTAHSVLNYSLDQQAALLERFLLEMGIGKIALIGHGLGALVGMAFAARLPQSVDRLMAVCCPLRYEAINHRLRTSSPVELADWLSNRSPETYVALMDSSLVDPQAVSASIVELQVNNPFYDFRKLNMPCLLVYGKKDQAIQAADPTLPLPSMMHRVTLENSGHFPMIEESHPFEQLLMKFLLLKSGVSPREIQMA